MPTPKLQTTSELDYLEILRTDSTSLLNKYLLMLEIYIIRLYNVNVFLGISDDFN